LGNNKLTNDRTESAWQAVSYGLNSVKIFAEVGGVYINFGLWAAALLPAWLVVRHFGNDAIASAAQGDQGFSHAESVSAGEPIEARIEKEV